MGRGGDLAIFALGNFLNSFSRATNTRMLAGEQADARKALAEQQERKEKRAYEEKQQKRMDELMEREQRRKTPLLSSAGDLKIDPDVVGGFRDWSSQQAPGTDLLTAIGEHLGTLKGKRGDLDAEILKLAATGKPPANQDVFPELPGLGLQLGLGGEVTLEPWQVSQKRQALRDLDRQMGDVRSWGELARHAQANYGYDPMVAGELPPSQVGQDMAGIGDPTFGGQQPMMPPDPQARAQAFQSVAEQAYQGADTQWIDRMNMGDLSAAWVIANDRNMPLADQTTAWQKINEITGIPLPDDIQQFIHGPMHPGPVDYGKPDMRLPEMPPGDFMQPLGFRPKPDQEPQAEPMSQGVDLGRLLKGDASALPPPGMHTLAPDIALPPTAPFEAPPDADTRTVKGKTRQPPFDGASPTSLPAQLTLTGDPLPNPIGNWTRPGNPTKGPGVGADLKEALEIMRKWRKQVAWEKQGGEGDAPRGTEFTDPELMEFLAWIKRMRAMGRAK